MVKGLKTLLVGIGVCVAIVLAHFMFEWRTESQLAQAITACDTWNKQPDSAKDLPGLLLFCQPHELEADLYKGTWTSPQKEVTEAMRKRGATRIYLSFVPAILFVFALPYLWYFLLRRVRELRDAVTGTED